MKVLLLAAFALAFLEDFVHCQINSVPGSRQTNCKYFHFKIMNLMGMYISQLD